MSGPGGTNMSGETLYLQNVNLSMTQKETDFNLMTIATSSKGFLKRLKSLQELENGSD